MILKKGVITIRNLNKLLNDYPILKQMDKHIIGIMEKHAINLHVLKKDVIKHHGQLCLGFPFILSGELDVTKISLEGDITYLYALRPGDLCHQGIKCLLNNNALSLQIEATKNSELIMIPPDIFNTYFMHNELFLTYLYNDLASKFETILNTQENIIHSSIDERINELIFNSGSTDLKITHQQIAVKLSTAREVVSRSLKKLEKEGKIVLSRGSIQIK